MSDALVNLSPDVAFGVWMDIKYMAHEALKSLEPDEQEQADAILSAQDLVDAERRFGTIPHV